ncbi:ABC transporter permease DevC [Mastigocoleus sp. MO_188.B34]|uniref:ABC transporter permease DevC n=1 Tax=Mastigocoleus sp. MO_188.B34 TaxID=3036635 RepID=UPI0026163A81|nr:ABC transporter permease DevC [Mastigocoleus sp. MO_188.B34]MDJ0697972.1 ABC transporter permease DevC [Mastigocoleus sp. MO_188.B34]
MLRTLSIAWAQLLHQKVQTIVTILGIAFTVVLLFMQVGFRIGLLESSTQFAASFQSDIVLISNSSISFSFAVPFSERRLNQALAFEEVEAVTPVYATMTSVKRLEKQPKFMASIQVIAFPLKPNVIDLPGVIENLDSLKGNNLFILDRKSRSELSSLITEVKNNGKVSAEITSVGFERKRIDIVGLFEMGASTYYNGNLITSEATFLNTFGLSSGEIIAGLVHVKPGVDVPELISRMKAYLPNDVRVMSKKELIKEDKTFIEYSSPMGIVFLFAMIFSIIIGIVILYQVLFQNISRFTKEYATLKALGYSHRFLVNIVLEQVLIFAISGYIPGFIISCFVYNALAEVTKMKFLMSFNIAIFILFLILLICIVSGVIATNKLKEANPVDVF